MCTLKLVAFAVVGLMFAVGCSAPTEEADDAEDGNSAVTTPRDKEEDSLAERQNARMAELWHALQNAKADDFGAAIPPNVKPSIAKLLSMYMHADFDTELRAYSFITGTNKAYIIETHVDVTGGGTKRNLYLYDAVGYPKAESTPVPLGKCEAPSLKADAFLTCTSAARGGLSMFEP